MEYWMFWKKHARHGSFVVYVPFNLFLLLCLCHFAPTHPLYVYNTERQKGKDELQRSCMKGSS